MITIAATLFILHLFFETLAIFIRYNYAALGVHMRGANYSNICAIFSRGFIALYGLSIAIMIEKLENNLNMYIFGMVISFFISACVSWYFSKNRLMVAELKVSFNHLVNILQFNLSNKSIQKFKLPLLVSVFIGIQFTATVIAYALCFKYKEQRLLIISMTPVFSMIGTLITVLLVEPKFAKHVDGNRENGYAIASVYLFARAISFSASAVLLVVLWFFIK